MIDFEWAKYNMTVKIYPAVVVTQTTFTTTTLDWTKRTYVSNIYRNTRKTTPMTTVMYRSDGLGWIPPGSLPSTSFHDTPFGSQSLSLQNPSLSCVSAISPAALYSADSHGLALTAELPLLRMRKTDLSGQA